jgi:hypothetical protein
MKARIYVCSKELTLGVLRSAASATELSEVLVSRHRFEAYCLIWHGESNWENERRF